MGPVSKNKSMEYRKKESNQLVNHMNQSWCGNSEIQGPFAQLLVSDKSVSSRTSLEKLKERSNRSRSPNRTTSNPESSHRGRARSNSRPKTAYRKDKPRLARPAPLAVRQESVDDIDLHKMQHEQSMLPNFNNSSSNQRSRPVVTSSPGRNITLASASSAAQAAAASAKVAAALAASLEEASNQGVLGPNELSKISALVASAAEAVIHSASAAQQLVDATLAADAEDATTETSFPGADHIWVPLR